MALTLASSASFKLLGLHIKGDLNMGVDVLSAKGVPNMGLHYQASLPAAWGYVKPIGFPTSCCQSLLQSFPQPRQGQCTSCK